MVALGITNFIQISSVYYVYHFMQNVETSKLCKSVLPAPSPIFVIVLHTLKTLQDSILTFDVSSHMYFKWKEVLWLLYQPIIYQKYLHVCHASFSPSSWSLLLGSLFSARGKLFGIPFNGNSFRDIFWLCYLSSSFNDNLPLGYIKIFISLFGFL